RSGSQVRDAAAPARRCGLLSSWQLLSAASRTPHRHKKYTQCRRAFRRWCKTPAVEGNEALTALGYRDLVADPCRKRDSRVAGGPYGPFEVAEMIRISEEMRASLGLELAAKRQEHADLDAAIHA